MVSKIAGQAMGRFSQAMGRFGRAMGYFCTKAQTFTQ
jgi:hypothetical protein